MWFNQFHECGAYMMDLLIGHLAPLFTLADLDGAPVTLQDFRGRVVLLNFWSCDCPVVERADGLLRDKMAEWGAQVVWISIAANANESPAQIRAAAAARELPIMLWDSTQQVVQAYAAQTTPHIFVLDSIGVLRYRGGLDDTTFRRQTPTRMYAFDAVEAVLKGEQPPVTESQPYGCTIVRFRPS
jgi:peroxiredoxin